jgi:hypothetical protein
VTSLIEAHGMDAPALLRPAWRGDAGWPALLPAAALPAFRTLSPTLMPDELIDSFLGGGATSLRTLDLGDPGTVIDGATPRDQLPPYEGPAQPPSTHANEWGAPAAATPEDAPLDRPTVARLDPA